MKLYIISGLGADFKVLERLEFPEHIEPIFIPWLIPYRKETKEHYIKRMMEKIDTREPFALLGYSFGGFIVQEIHRQVRAQKVVIMGSIRSNSEMPRIIKWAKYTKLPKWLPTAFFSEKPQLLYGKIRSWVIKTERVMHYFRVRNPYYLKWCLEQISDWKFAEESKDVIQILGDHDLIFPAKNSQPDYVIKGGTHLFPVTKPKVVSRFLHEIFKQ